ncbi:hypothetical protein AALB39_28950 [Lachnospiraceae bacterium 54-53]
MKKVLIKTRSIGKGMKICVDAQGIYKSIDPSLQKELLLSLAEVFRDAYREDILITTDYLALCEITIKEKETLSTKLDCNLVMTPDRAVMKLKSKADIYAKRIRECFYKFYAEEAI